MRSSIAPASSLITTPYSALASESEHAARRERAVADGCDRLAVPVSLVDEMDGQSRHRQLHRRGSAHHHDRVIHHRWGVGGSAVDLLVLAGGILDGAGVRRDQLEQRFLGRERLFDALQLLGIDALFQGREVGKILLR
jgi:hypothetical protein